MRILKEVKRLNPNLNSEELTVENSMSKSFHKILQRELDPVWHQLSGKSRQLVSDLKTLRLVLTYLTQVTHSTRRVHTCNQLTSHSV